MKLLIDESLAVFLWHQTAETAASAEPQRDPNQSSACRLWTTIGLRPAKPGRKPKKCTTVIISEACIGVLGIQNFCQFTFRDMGYY